MKEYQKCAEEMLEFIRKSPTAFHAVANIKTELENSGFAEVKETESWELEREGLLCDEKRFLPDRVSDSGIDRTGRLSYCGISQRLSRI